MTENQENLTRTRLSLQPRPQLIDLNKEYVNCEINFECKSADATKDFEVLVINQDQLDTVDLSNLEMKRTRGGFVSGNIVADENKQQNYFLVVKGINEDPVDVDLEIRVAPIVPDPNKLAHVRTESTTSPATPILETPSPQPWYKKLTQKPAYMFILAAIVIILVVVLIMWSKKNQPDGECNDDAVSTVSSSSSSSKSSKSSSSSSQPDIKGIRNIILQQKEKRPVA